MLTERVTAMLHSDRIGLKVESLKLISMLTERVTVLIHSDCISFKLSTINS